jgi:hemoglobin-like flavoprotein
MTPQQAQIVKNSFRTAMARRDRLAGCFLAELFARDPALWEKLRGESGWRDGSFANGLAAIVASIDRLHPIAAVLEWVAYRGAARGLAERHHVAIADALMAALEAVIGPEFNPIHRQAWWLACRSVIDVMVEALHAEPLAA